MLTKKTQNIIALTILLICIVAFLWGCRIVLDVPPRVDSLSFGATFSTKYAKELGLDWREVFVQSMDDLGLRKFRIPVYWDEVEPLQNRYYFNDIDWILQEAQKRNATVILAIGRKVPRWPECHRPKWVGALGEKNEESEILNLLNKIVVRYKENATVVAWQIENEPLFNFGECPKQTSEFLEKEIALVKNLDSSRSVIITDSGELSTWVRTGSAADILGISLYRVAFNKMFGYWYYPLSPAFYRDRIKLISPLIKHVFVSELQVEPWVEGFIVDTPLDVQYQSMNQYLMENNFDFVSRVGVNEVYIWGIEWWYWLRTKGDSSMWQRGKELLSQYDTTRVSITE